MLAEFSWNHYGLILAVVVLHYPIGYLLTVKKPLTGSLVGLSMSSLVVGILANVFALGISFYISISMAVLGLLWLWMILKEWRQKQAFKFSLRNGAVVILLILGAGLFFHWNNPAKTFYREDGDKQFLTFNDHYTYYSSQSLEMLSAEYPSRLKAMNLFPKPWAQYHFFNSSTQAIAQFLLPHQNLNTYFMAQLVLGLLVLLSLLEVLWTLDHFSLFESLWKSIFWFFLGFSLFGSSLVWTLGTTGTFSVFAIFHLIWSFWRKDLSKVLLFSLILGASAFRFLPITFAVILLWIYEENILNRRLRLRENLLHIRSFFKGQPALLTSFLIFGLYVLCTLFFGGKNHEGRFFSEGPYSQGWMAILTLHNLLAVISQGIFSSSFFQLRDPPPIFIEGWSISMGVGLSVLFGLLAFCYYGWRVHGGRSSYFQFLWEEVRRIPLPQKKSYRNVLVSFIGVAVLYGFKLSFVTLLYLYFFIMLLLFLKKSASAESFEVFKRSLFLMLTVTFVMLLTGSNGVKAPMSYVTYDLGLWVVFGLFLYFGFSYKKIGHWAMVLFPMFLFTVQTRGLFKYPEMSSLNITELEAFSDNAVDEDRFLSKDLVNFARGDEKKLEAYSAIFNGRLSYSPDYKTHRNFYHVNTED